MSGIYALKPWFVVHLRSVEEALVARRVSPNAITVTAALVSAAAGAALVGGAVLDEPLVWLAVLPLGIVRLALNALDGSVARRLGLSSGFGAAVNELGDRACDLALFAPLIVVAPPWLVVTGICAMTLTSTAGVMSLALTGTRDTRGPMGKADRVMLLGLAALVAAATGSQAPFAVALALVIAGSFITIGLRMAPLPKEANDVRQ